MTNPRHLCRGYCQACWRVSLLLALLRLLGWLRESDVLGLEGGPRKAAERVRRDQDRLPVFGQAHQPFGVLGLLAELEQAIPPLGGVHDVAAVEARELHHLVGDDLDDSLEVAVDDHLSQIVRRVQDVERVAHQLGNKAVEFLLRVNLCRFVSHCVFPIESRM